MDRSPVFGSSPADSVAHFALGFPSASPLKGLTLPTKLTPRLIKQKAHRQAWVSLIALRSLVSVRFQVLFHSPHRGAFHFSVALLSAIGRQGILSLGGWSPLLHASFHETRITRELLEERSSISSTGLSPALAWLSNQFDYRLPLSLHRGSEDPTRLSQPSLHNGFGLTCRKFGLFRFRSPLLTKSMLSFFS